MENPTTQPIIVQCNDVVKAYQQNDITVHALRSVNLTVHRGEFVSLAGVSGSGKTTLLNMMGGLDHLSSGEIYVENVALSTLNKSQLANLRLHKIGFVFQAYNLIPVLNAYENVEFIMQLQGIPANERRERSHHILTRVGLGELGQRRPAELSGGQQQRVAVARALVAMDATIVNLVYFLSTPPA